jgi:hypothetical protein
MEAFHAKGLLKKRPFDFIICLFKINFQLKYPIHFLPMNFVDGLMENRYSFKNMPSRDKRSLSRSNYLLCNFRNPICCYFCKDFETHMEQTNGSILLNLGSIFFFWQKDDCFEVETILALYGVRVN